MTNKESGNYTTIQVRKTTRDRINDLRRGNETQDEFVRKLIDQAHPLEQGA